MSIKDAHIFLSRFQKEYKSFYGKEYRINRVKAKWAAQEILDSFGFEGCLDALEWAFKVSDTPFTWEWYTKNVDRLLEARSSWERDGEERKTRRELSKKWLQS